MCLRNIECSSACRLYGLNREDSAAEIHCLAYSLGARSVGIETLGRTSYLGRCVVAYRDFLGASLKLWSNPVGEVALLDIDESAEDASSLSVAIEEAIESRALSDFKCRWPADISLETRSALQLEG